MQRGQKQTGFTIVELLIVIVVIGVLAAITVVAFNGVQERAESAKITSLANAYVKGLKKWSAESGSNPVPGVSCIVPAVDAPSGTCALSARWNVNTPVDGAFNQALANHSGVSAQQLGKYGESNPRGQMWYLDNYYGDNRAVLFYEVGPNSDCGLSNVLTPTPGYDNMTLTNAKFTNRTSSYTQCIVEVSKY